MTWLAFAVAALLAAGWLATVLLLSFTRDDVVVMEDQVERLARENGVLRDRLGIDWRDEVV